MTKAQTTSHHPVSPRDDVSEFQRASLPTDLEAMGMPVADSMAPLVVKTKPDNVTTIDTSKAKRPKYVPGMDN